MRKAKEPRKSRIEKTTPCSDDYAVSRVWSSGGATSCTRKKPCRQCPWRTDVPTGVFPPEAFRVSASTAYDAAEATFGCHMSGADKPSTCAGFILRHSDNNLGVRLAQSAGRLDLSRISDAGLPLYPSYREMAIANGVEPDEPCLKPVRANGESFTYVEPDPRVHRSRRRSLGLSLPGDDPVAALRPAVGSEGKN